MEQLPERKLATHEFERPAEYDYESGYYAFFFSGPDELKLEIVHVDVTGSLAYWQQFTESETPL